MEFFPSSANEDQTSNSGLAALLVPALSTGNVGQLAVDLIISSMRAHKSGFLDDANVLPCIGNDPFATIDKGELALALEVFERHEYNLRIVQQRSPVIQGSMFKFAKNFSHWASDQNTKEVIILSGVDAGKQRMCDMGSAQISYLSSANPDGTDARCEQLGWKRFEYFSPSSNEWKLLESRAVQPVDQDQDQDREEVLLSDEMYYPSLPFASLFSCCKAKGLNVLCILCFCSEGDNIQDAFFLSDAFQNFLSAGNFNGRRLFEWVIPHSWKTVYGPPPDPSIF